jgi:hypothetical protein
MKQSVVLPQSDWQSSAEMIEELSEEFELGFT